MIPNKFCTAATLSFVASASSFAQGFGSSAFVAGSDDDGNRIFTIDNYTRGSSTPASETASSGELFAFSSSNAGVLRASSRVPDVDTGIGSYTSIASATFSDTVRFGEAGIGSTSKKVTISYTFDGLINAGPRDGFIWLSFDIRPLTGVGQSLSFNPIGTGSTQIEEPKQQNFFTDGEFLYGFLDAINQDESELFYLEGHDYTSIGAVSETVSLSFYVLPGLSYEISTNLRLQTSTINTSNTSSDFDFANTAVFEGYEVSDGTVTSSTFGELQEFNGRFNYDAAINELVPAPGSAGLALFAIVAAARRRR